MKVFLYITTLTFVLNLVATQDQAASQPEQPKKPRLLKKPRVYNAILKSDEELIPSQSYPAVAPVIRPFYTGLFPYGPIIIPQVHPYHPELYGSSKVSSNYGQDRPLMKYNNYPYPSRDLTPPRQNDQENIRFGSPILDQIPVEIKEDTPSRKEAQNLNLPNNSEPNQTSNGNNNPQDTSNVFDPKFDTFPRRLNYEGDLNPTVMADSYFPQDLRSNEQDNADYDSFLEKQIQDQRKQSKETSPASAGGPKTIDQTLLQNFFNYKPEDSEIPNVPPPPLPVSNSNSNSTKKKIDYPNAPATLFSI